MDDELEVTDEFLIDEDAIWGCWIEDSDNQPAFRIYINENQTLTFSEEAARALLKSIVLGLEELQRKMGVDNG